MKIKTAIIGYGLSGKVFHGPLLKSSEHFEVVAVVSSRKNEVQEDFPKAKVLSFEDAVGESELIIIATPHKLHYEQAKYALEQGKHVVVEKPFTATLEQATELFKLAKDKKLTLAVFHNRRFDADFLTLKKIIDNKILGDIVTIESHFDRFRPIPKENAWREEAGDQSGVWWDLGPHLIDQAKQLFGLPNEITYDIGQQRDVKADDYFDVTFKYPKGRRIHLRASCIVKDYGFRFRVHGTKGSALFKSLDVQENQMREGMKPNDSKFGIYPNEMFSISQGFGCELERGNYQRFYEEVFQSISNKKNFFVSEEDVLFTTSVLLGKI